MITTHINGIDVKFPFEPYEIQKNYMSRVIECLSTEQHGVLESPTGTGKTLSLLCASLAWLEAKKAQLQVERHVAFENQEDDFIKKLNEQLIQKSGKNSRSILGLPTIIYASRTHSQLSQAVSEMRLTAYNYMNACVLGSREQMCIHPEVAKEKNSTTKVILCSLKTKTRTCNYYNNYQTRKEDPQIRSKNIVDIEDLVLRGKKQKFCPYYMSKELKGNADIIFMPYNYLLEPKFRRNLGIELANNIVILDEAHNVEKMCEDSASLQLKSSDIALAIDEVTVCMKILTDEPTGFDDEDIPKDFGAEDLVLLKQMFLDLESEVDKIPLNSSPEGTSFGGLYMLELVEKAGINAGNHQIVITLIEKLIEYLAVISQDNPYQRKGNSLRLMEDALRVVFMDVSETYKQRVDRCYKVHIVEEKKQSSGRLVKAGGRILNFWCFSPGFGMKMLIDQKIRCCILTSGTLAPLKPLITEFEFKNPIHIENPHVVKDEQLCVRIISNGPDNERLNCTYQNRENANYLRSLGSTILNITRLIPSGLLIFFPSYPIMNNCREHWQKAGIWENINNLKPIYTESREKELFSNTMTEYYNKIKDPSAKGAIFMGVCRGKISEGLDFADFNGRGVIIIGLPYPPLKDPKIILKKRYLDKCNAENSEYIRGDKWYTLEACRAVNQAIGRVIRHRNDYGAILLLDERFKYDNIQSQLSLWLRDRIKTVQNFGELTRDLRLFFMNASEKFPLTEKKKVYVNEPSQSSLGEPSSSQSGPYKCFGFNSDIELSSEQSTDSSTSEKLKAYRRCLGRQVEGISKKMKIRLVPNSASSASTEGESLSDGTKEYIAMVRRAFDIETFKKFISVLHSYRQNKDIEALKASLDAIFKSKHNLRYLLQGVERYMDPVHKQSFNEYWERNR